MEFCEKCCQKTSYVMQNDRPKSFTVSGIISEMTRTGIVKSAKFAIKSVNENETMGSHLNASTE